MASISQCTARNVTDEKLCQLEATSANRLFCSFHSKQAFGLYMGYKRRNAHLDRLAANPPMYLANNPLANNTFKTVTTKPLCQQIHHYLFDKLKLLDRVIRARKMHKSLFYSMDYDYGHSKFIENLEEEQVTVSRALERIEHRTVEVLYKKEKWYDWVRKCQEDEEAQQTEEQKRVRHEASLFRRHWKATDKKYKEMRAKEDQMKQDIFLEEAYRERMAAMAEEEGSDDDDFDWDPIEDDLENSRGNFLGLIQRFLWMVELDADTSKAEGEKTPEDTELAAASTSALPDDNSVLTDPLSALAINEEEESKENVDPAEQEPASQAVEKDNAPAQCTKPSHSKNGKGKAKKKGKRAPKHKFAPKSTNRNTEQSQASSQSQETKMHGTDDKIFEAPIETREEMTERLMNGTAYAPIIQRGGYMIGSIDNPVERTKTVTFDEDESKRLLSEIEEIKILLFCRLLLSHAALLPAALRANSIEEFLADEQVPAAHLRDLCIRMEAPGLQDIRDACADLFRSDDERVDVEETSAADPGVEHDSSDDEWEQMRKKRLFVPKKPKGALPEKWISKREEEKARFKEVLGEKNPLQDVMGQGLNGGTVVDFGEIKDNKVQRKKIQVRICGHHIYNYPSDKAMSRGGWLHFCIIAKDSTLFQAVELCRSWDEFYELNVLAIWRYFPGANWNNWVGPQYRKQMLQLGFILYFESSATDAEELQKDYLARKSLFAGRAQSSRRQTDIFEARNFMCAHIKRDDAVSRRLIQYLSMQSHRLLLLVRDGETGELIIKPPEDQKWLYRIKQGPGRPGRNEWHMLKEIGPEFFQEVDEHRPWRFGFQEHYDVYIWDLEPGEPFPRLYNAVQEMLWKAWRFREGIDLYRPAASVIKTLWRKSNTDRVRDILPGENRRSIYEELHSGGEYFHAYGSVPSNPDEAGSRGFVEEKVPRTSWYGKADALEDKILFPGETFDETNNPSHVGTVEVLKAWENEGLSMTRFIEGQYYDSDSDYETDSNPDLLRNIAKNLGSDEEDSEWDSEDEDEYEQDEGSGAREEINTAPIDFASILASTYPEECRDSVARVMARPTPDRNPTTHAGMDAEFMRFLDQEKARIFKEVWHNADLEPNAQERYLEMKSMAKYSRRFKQLEMKSPQAIISWQLLDVLNVEKGQDSKDLHKAVGKMAPFFHPAFFDYKKGTQFKDSLIFNQEERAKLLPHIRSHASVAVRDPEFWNAVQDDCEKIPGVKTCAELAIEEEFDDIPEEWDISIRPVLAHLYKTGVIRTRAYPHAVGQAMARKDTVGSKADPTRNKYDLFIDYRIGMEEYHENFPLADPYAVPPFKRYASAFAAKHPDAKFAVLKLWSAPHFYPLMIGPDNHDATSFRDLFGRNFIWKFIPKDSFKSEWSMHYSASQRISPYKKFMGNQVVCKRDAYLVMGKDEKDLFRMASATTWAIQRAPWRWEVDIWKSWVNVDIEFLERLDDEWFA